MSDERPMLDIHGLCQAIGFVVVQWALIEQQVDNWVNVVFDKCDGRRLANKGIPRAFKRKIDFVNKCLRQLPQLSEFRDEGVDIGKRLRALSNNRNDLIHGAIIDIWSKAGEFRFRIIGYEETHHTLREFRFNIDDFHILEKSLGETVTEAIAFSQKLGDRFLK